MFWGAQAAVVGAAGALRICGPSVLVMTEPDTFHARCIDSDFTGDYSLFWWFVGPLGNLLGPLRGLLGPLGGLLEVSWQSRQQHRRPWPVQCSGAVFITRVAATTHGRGAPDRITRTGTGAARLERVVLGHTIYALFRLKHVFFDRLLFWGTIKLFLKWSSRESIMSKGRA